MMNIYEVLYKKLTEVCGIWTVVSYRIPFTSVNRTKERLTALETKGIIRSVEVNLIETNSKN